MNIFQLECFLAVAESLSFAKAAKKMNISQPAITHQIKSLEDELETQLFIRSTRIVTLTDEGNTFITDAKNIIATATQAKLRLCKQNEVICTITLGFLNNQHLESHKELLINLQKNIPNFYPKIIVDKHDRLQQLLENGLLDILFDFEYDRDLSPNLSFKKIKTEKIVFLCNKESKYASKKIISINDIKKERIIVCEPSSFSLGIEDLHLKLTNGSINSNFLFCNSFDILNTLVDTGYGVSIVPSCYASNNSNLFKIPIEELSDINYGVYFNINNNKVLLKDVLKIIFRKKF